MVLDVVGSNPISHPEKANKHGNTASFFANKKAPLRRPAERGFLFSDSALLNDYLPGCNRTGGDEPEHVNAFVKT